MSSPLSPSSATTAAAIVTIDLRSDTVTKPTAAMRAAMSTAEVGDDVFMDDPTVLSLQSYAAELLGKEAALYVPSGTMANLIAVLLHCHGRGADAIVGDQSHIYVYEQGGASQFGGVLLRPVKNSADGTLPLQQIAEAVRTGTDPHQTQTCMIAIENTQNRCGGAVLSVEYTRAVAALAREHGLKFHIDGARLMNAAAALNVQPSELVREADSVSVCLSKGLAAPVGSLLLGSNEFIARARRLRKALGGGMRQCGVIAAAGLVALKEMRERIKDDHVTAALLQQHLRKIEGVDAGTDAQTNIVYFSLSLSAFRPSFTAATLVAELKARGVLANATAPMTVRFVTHYHITPELAEKAVEIVKEILEKNRL